MRPNRFLLAATSEGEIAQAATTPAYLVGRRERWVPRRPLAGLTR